MEVTSPPLSVCLVADALQFLPGGDLMVRNSFTLDADNRVNGPHAEHAHPMQRLFGTCRMFLHGRMLFGYRSRTQPRFHTPVCPFYLR